MARRSAMGASKTVAVKLLGSSMADNPLFRRMFIDEVRLSMMLNHSNLVQVFDVGINDGRFYLVMEWVDGLDLGRLAAYMRDAGERLSTTTVAYVVGEVLRGLAYLHGLGARDEQTIVHRDISPQNVLVSVSGEVKIGDFGVARMSNEETSGTHVRGKLRYMPPEQIRGESKHPTLDLFAVGALLQELLDGVIFRGGLARDHLFGAVLVGEVPPVLRTDVPEVLLELRNRLLAADPTLRLQSAREALELLRSWSGYRDVSDELAEVVRRAIAVVGAGARDGTHDDVTVPEPRPNPAGDPSSRGHDASSGSTPTLHTGLDRTKLRAVAKRRAVWAQRLAVLAVSGLLGFGGAWVSGLSEAASPVWSMQPLQVVHERSARASDEVPTSERQVPSPEIAEPPPLVVIGPAPASGGSDEPTPHKPKRTPSRVAFSAGPYVFAWIRVNGRELALTPRAELELPPGSHTVQLRARRDQPWIRAGRIRVEAGKRYRIKLDKPAGLVVQAVSD